MMKKINKNQLIEKIKSDLDQSFQQLKQAALATYEDATHEESKPENEYDTRGLEASYLAGAQGQRLAEIEELFTMYRFLPLHQLTSNDAIKLSALVEIQHNDKKQIVFLVPKGGGLTVKIDDSTIHVIASTSPLGESLLGLYVGDTAVVETSQQTLEYDILDIQ